MDELITKIKKIQNKQQSLMWGSADLSADEILFAVGNRAYPRQPHFFIISKNLGVSILEEDNSKTYIDHFSDNSSVATCIIGLLKEWFPAKGQTESTA